MILVTAKAICCKGVKNEAEMAGYQMLVRGEIMRGKYRNSFENPKPLHRKTETVKFELPGVAHTFKKGHRLMIQVQSTGSRSSTAIRRCLPIFINATIRDFVPCNIKLPIGRTPHRRLFYPYSAADCFKTGNGRMRYFGTINSRGVAPAIAAKPARRAGFYAVAARKRPEGATAAHRHAGPCPRLEA